MAKKVASEVVVSPVAQLLADSLRLPEGEVVKLAPADVLHLPRELFPLYNMGREDNDSWGNPIRDLGRSMSFGWQIDKPGKGVRVGDTYNGISPFNADCPDPVTGGGATWRINAEGKPLEEFLPELVSLVRGFQEKWLVDHLTDLALPDYEIAHPQTGEKFTWHAAKPSDVVAMFQSLYRNADGSWKLPLLLGWSATRRFWTLPVAIAAARHNGFIADPAAYTVRMAVMAYRGEQARLDAMRSENAQDQRAYSDVGLLVNATELVSRAYGMTALAQALGLDPQKDKGRVQKVFGAASAGITPAGREVHFIKRLTDSKAPGRVIDEKGNVSVTYVAGEGWIPLRSVSWQRAHVLAGKPTKQKGGKEKFADEDAAKLVNHGGNFYYVPNAEEFERVIKNLFLGVKDATSDAPATEGNKTVSLTKDETDALVGRINPVDPLMADVIRSLLKGDKQAVLDYIGAVEKGEIIPAQRVAPLAGAPPAGAPPAGAPLTEDAALVASAK